MHNGRGCPGAQNRLIHSSLPHLLPSGSPETLLGLDVVKTHINPNVIWLCWLQSHRHQEEEGNSHFSLRGEWLGMALAYPNFLGSSWDLECGDSLGPLVPWPPGRFQCFLLRRLGWRVTQHWHCGQRDSQDKEELGGRCGIVKILGSNWWASRRLLEACLG